MADDGDHDFASMRSAVLQAVQRLRTATAVTDAPNAQTVTMYANHAYGALAVGTALEVTLPLVWSPPTEFVQTHSGGQEYWIQIGDLKPFRPTGELAKAVQAFLQNKMGEEMGGALKRLLLATRDLDATRTLDPDKAAALLADAAKAIDELVILRSNGESRAARRGMPFVLPEVLTKAQTTARLLMQRGGVMHVMNAVTRAGATNKGLALYRDLRALLDLSEFRGLAGDSATASRFEAFEEAVAAGVRHAALIGEPDPVLAGGTLAHETPVISPGTAFQSVGGETTGALVSGDGPTGEVLGEPVIAAENPWPAAPGVRTVTHVRDDRPGHRSLYIDGRPSADDVMQTGLGDCFYLSLVASVADRDPGRILRLLPDTSGNSFRVTFYFRASKQSTRSIPRVVELPVTLAYQGEKLQGARFRVVPTGCSRWTRHADGVHEERLYKTALWAPLMEKAYARFAQEHGIYGQLFGQDPTKETKSGYDLIGDTGGSSHWLASVIFGDELRERTTHEVMLGPGEPGAEPPSADLVATLARLANQPTPQEMVHLTVGGDEQAMAQQASLLAGAIMASSLRATLPVPITNQLNALIKVPKTDERIDIMAAREIASGLTDALVYVEDTPLVAKRNQVRRQLVVLSKLTCPTDDKAALGVLKSAQQAVAPGAKAFDDTASMDRTVLPAWLPFELKKAQGEFLAEKEYDDYTLKLLRKLIGWAESIPESMASDDSTVTALQALRADRSGSLLLNLAVSLRNKSDSSPGQRFVYASHAYAVLKADFRDAQGRAIEVTTANAAEATPKLDTTKSLVTLRNPHHENQPDPGATKSPGTGEFTLSLAEFARQFSNVREAIVKKTT